MSLADTLHKFHKSYLKSQQQQLILPLTNNITLNDSFNNNNTNLQLMNQLQDDSGTENNDNNYNLDDKDANNINNSMNNSGVGIMQQNVGININKQKNGWTVQEICEKVECIFF